MTAGKDDGLPIYLTTARAHIGIAPTPDALRVLLDAPEDLSFTQWQLAPLGTISQRLTGCTWQVVGCLVPVTDDPPEYPFIQYSVPPTRLQAWLWRTSQPPRQLYGDLRWHPRKGRSFVIAGPGSTDQLALLQVWQWLKVADSSSRGRRLYTGRIRDAVHFRDIMVNLIKLCDKQVPPYPVTTENFTFHRI